MGIGDVGERKEEGKERRRGRSQGEIKVEKREMVGA